MKILLLRDSPKKYQVRGRRFAKERGHAGNVNVGKLGAYSRRLKLTLASAASADVHPVSVKTCQKIWLPPK